MRVFRWFIPLLILALAGIPTHRNDLNPSQIKAAADALNSGDLAETLRISTEANSSPRDGELGAELAAYSISAHGAQNGESQAVTFGESKLRQGRWSHRSRAILLLALGRTALAEGDDTRSFRYFARAAKAAPRFEGNALSYYWLAMNAFEQGTPAAASRKLDRLSMILRDTGEWSSALKARAQALRAALGIEKSDVAVPQV